MSRCGAEGEGRAGRAKVEDGGSRGGDGGGGGGGEIVGGSGGNQGEEEGRDRREGHLRVRRRHLEREGDIQTRMGRKRDQRGKKSRIGPDWTDSDLTSSVWVGSVRLGPVRFGPIRFGPVQFVPVRFGTVRFGFGPVRFGTVRNGPYRDGLERFGAERCGPARRICVVRNGLDRSGADRSEADRTGPEDRSWTGRPLEPCGERSRWRSAGCGVAPACPAGRGTPVVPDGRVGATTGGGGRRPAVRAGRG
jgi:hypothetical protein